MIRLSFARPALPDPGVSAMAVGEELAPTWLSVGRASGAGLHRFHLPRLLTDTAALGGRGAEGYGRVFLVPSPQHEVVPDNDGEGVVQRTCGWARRRIPTSRLRLGAGEGSKMRLRLILVGLVVTAASVAAPATAQEADGGCAEFGAYVSGMATSSGGLGTIVSTLGKSGPGVVADAVESRQDATCPP